VNVTTTEQLLTAEQVADLVQVPVSTVYRWNVTRSGPTPCKVGKYVRYRRADVDAWIASRAGDGPERVA
jgi:excisionase family DNA binding protein